MNTNAETLDFDPIDLVMVAAGWQSQGHPEGPSEMRAAMFVEVARMLHRLWLEIDATEWAGVFAYDVAEPLGRLLGGLPVEQQALAAWDAARFEEAARKLIAEAQV